MGRNVFQQKHPYNKVLMNIFSNFVPNKNFTFDDKDSPRINKFVKRRIKWKNEV